MMLRIGLNFIEPIDNDAPIDEEMRMGYLDMESKDKEDEMIHI